MELASVFLDLARSHIGYTREELEQAWSAVAVAPHERRLADGLSKLIEDRCEFDSDSAINPEELRREVFLRASQARSEGTFQRDSLVAAISDEHSVSVDTMERSLYADLRAAHLLKGVRSIAPIDLVDAYDLSQAQAVLLRAVCIAVDVECRTPLAYRALFQKL